MIRMVKCPVCKEDVGNKKICRNCGHIIRSEDSIDSNSSNNIEFCANCGEKIDDDSQYCDACGYDIKNDIPAKIEDNISKTTTKNNNTLFYIIGMIAVILILTTAVGLYLSHGNTTINSVNFNIPNGYTVDIVKASEYDKLINIFNSNNVHYEFQAYTKDYDTVYILVKDVPVMNQPSGTPMKIKGHDGIVDNSNLFNVQSFTYNENGKEITIVGNMNTIESVIPYNFMGMIGGK